MTKKIFKNFLSLILAAVFLGLIFTPTINAAQTCKDQCTDPSGNFDVECYRSCIRPPAAPGDSLFGIINPPPGVSNFGAGGLATFVNVILKILVVGAGLFSLFNFVLAGYDFLSAGNDPKKIEGAWGKIWQTALGLAFAAGAFVLAAIFGKIIFNDYNALLQIKIFGPQ